MASIGYIASSTIPCSTNTSTSRITSGSVRLHPFADPPFDQTDRFGKSPHLSRRTRSTLSMDTSNPSLTTCSSSFCPCIGYCISACLFSSISGVSSCVHLSAGFRVRIPYTFLADPRLGHDHRTPARDGHKRTSSPHSPPSLFHCQLRPGRALTLDWSSSVAVLTLVV